MEDETWSSTAVKLFAHLYLSISLTIHDPNLSAGKYELLGALLMRRYIHSTLQGDFQTDMQTSDWSIPRLWLLPKLANCTGAILLGPASRTDIARQMVDSEFLLEGRNLEMLLEYVHWIGAGVDEVLDSLIKRVEDEPLARPLLVGR
jgi:hypothetical protein